MIKYKITWEEFGERDIRDIKKIAIGKNYCKYEKTFPYEEFIEFLNFQQNRQVPSEIKILSLEILKEEDHF